MQSWDWNDDTTDGTNRITVRLSAIAPRYLYLLVLDAYGTRPIFSCDLAQCVVLP